MSAIPSFSLLIKPVSADCNLRCSYCFYMRSHAGRHGSPNRRISSSVLESIIKSYMATEQPMHVFCWQGGEPALMGLDFYRKVVELQRKFSNKGATVLNTLQTNATAIDDNFARFLSDSNFLVGVSLDGPAEIHNQYRKYSDGRGSHSDVMRGLECLRRNHVECNVLALISDINVTRGKQVYNYLRGLGFVYHQYIPCVEFAPDGQPLSYSISGKEWGDFLCDVYDEWIISDTRKVSIRLFDSMISCLAYGVSNSCQMSESCSQYFVVEYNGDVYPCDFFVEPDLKLGNTQIDSWADLVESKKYMDFGKQKSNVHKKCTSCRFMKYCNGDCLKHRFYGKKDANRLSWLCSGMEQFCEHALPGLKELARGLRPSF